jgi:HEAT repeat protein
VRLGTRLVICAALLLVAPSGAAADDADLAKKLADPDPAVRAAAVRAVGQSYDTEDAATKVDTDALRRALGVSLSSTDARVRAAAAASLGDLMLGQAPRLAQALSDPAPPVRAAALWALVEMRAISEDDERFELGYRLTPMVPLLDDADGSVRAAALAGLAAYEDVTTESHEIVRAKGTRILAMTRDPDARVRAAALRALTGLQLHENIWTKPVVSRTAVDAAFEEGCRDAVPAVRAAAAKWFVGRKDLNDDSEAKFVAMLRTQLRDSDPGVRWSAAASLWTHTHDPAGLVPVLSEALIATDGPGDWAMQTIHEIGPAAREAVPAMIGKFGRGTDTLFAGLGGYAAEAMYDVGPEAEAVLPAIAEALRSPAHFRRLDAAVGIAALHGQDARRADLVASAWTKETESDVRVALLESFAQIAPDDVRLDAMTASALAGKWSEPSAAVWVIGRSARGRFSTSREKLTPLVEAWASRESGRWASAWSWRAFRSLDASPQSTRQPSAWEALTSLGPDDADLVPALISWLDSAASAPDGARVPEALGRMGAAGRSASGSLARVLSDSGLPWPVRIACAEASVAVGGEAEPAVRVLMEALDVPSGDRDALSTRARAGFALGRLGTRARSAIPALEAHIDALEGTDRIALGIGLTAVSGQTDGHALYDWPLDAYDTRFCREAVRTLARLGPAAAEFVPAFERAADLGRAWTTGPVSNPFRSPGRANLDLAREAVQALGACGPAAGPALPHLRRLRADTRLAKDVDTAIARIEK